MQGLQQPECLPGKRRRSRSQTVLCQAKKEVPVQQKVLSGFLGLSSLPYSSYIPSPETFLHGVDPRIKQVGTVYLLYLLMRSGMQGQVIIAGWLLVTTLLNTPWRIARPTLIPLLTVSTVCFVIAACLGDGPPPPVQSHVPVESLDGLASLADVKPYTYVFFEFWFLNVTKRSIHLAVSTVSLVFVALQSASLCLITTSPEQLALSLRQLMSPLQLLGVPVKQIGFSLLISLRFLSTVFDEMRNLALGVAVRGVDWKAFSPMGSLQLLANVITQLFRKLFQTSSNVAQAMVIRGFIGPEEHQLYLMDTRTKHIFSDLLAVLMLIVLSVSVIYID